MEPRPRRISDENVHPGSRATFWETVFKYAFQDDVEMMDPFTGAIIITSPEKAGELMARWEIEQGEKR